MEASKPEVKRTLDTFPRNIREIKEQVPNSPPKLIRLPRPKVNKS